MALLCRTRLLRSCAKCMPTRRLKDRLLRSNGLWANNMVFLDATERGTVSLNEDERFR